MQENLGIALAVETFDLVRQFGDFTAVDRINLNVGAQLFGFLGPTAPANPLLSRCLPLVISNQRQDARLSRDLEVEPLEVSAASASSLKI